MVGSILKRLAKDKLSASSSRNEKVEEKKRFNDIDTKGQCYETFYGCNLQMGQRSKSVCPWRAFPSKSSVCEKGKVPTQQTLKGASQR